MIQTKIPQQFSFGDIRLQLCIPDERSVKEKYTQDLEKGLQPSFPYWAKLWPASLALCDFVFANQQMFSGKTVLELAAGLGLPSLLASYFAEKVTCSDHSPEAMDIVYQSGRLNNINNLDCRVIDWHQYPSDLKVDIVLLSDISYDPQEFDVLHTLLLSLLDKGTIIVLSTPQRIMAKPFIEKLLPFCTAKQTGRVETATESAEIFIMQLEKAQ